MQRKITSLKPINELTFTRKLETDKDTYLHEIHIAKKTVTVQHDGTALSPKYQNQWFVKKSFTHLDAYGEVVAQEFFRLIYTPQPKTRLYIDLKDKKIPLYVASKEIVNFYSLDDANESDKQILENLSTGKWKGLGIIHVLSLFLEENDLKYGNIGIDKNNNLIKIDGDHCFADIERSIKSKRCFFNKDDICNLPFLRNYRPHNWFGVIDEKIASDTPLFHTSFSEIPHYRQEIHETIFKILLIPHQFIRDFVSCYVYDEQKAKCLSNELINRTFLLYDAIRNNSSFKAFLRQLDTTNFTKQFIEQIQAFHPTGKKTFSIDTTSLMRLAAFYSTEFLNTDSTQTNTNTCLQKIKQPVSSDNEPQPTKKGKFTEDATTTMQSATLSDASINLTLFKKVAQGIVVSHADHYKISTNFIDHLMYQRAVLSNEQLLQILSTNIVVIEDKSYHVVSKSLLDDILTSLVKIDDGYDNARILCTTLIYQGVILAPNQCTNEDKEQPSFTR